MAVSKTPPRWALPACLLLVLAILLHFCLWKQGMFIDEIYTYGLSNSHYMPFIGDGADDRISEQLLTREDFFDYLAVTGSEDSFDFSSVYYNQAEDVHPPLHYWIINLSSSLAQGSFSKWIGLVPDLIIFLGCLYVLFRLCVLLFEDERIGLLAVLLYGLSRVGISTAIMIRMYVLMTFFTLLLALLVVKELRSPSRRKEPAIGLCIFLGLMTQYYFVFYAFFLCAGAVIYLGLRRDWKSLLFFAVFAFAGVGLMLLVFPPAIRQLTADRIVSGGNALENLGNLAAWPGRIRYYFGQIRRGLPAAVITGLLALIPLFLFRKDVKEAGGAGNRLFWLVFLPVLPTVVVAAVISPVVEGRYIYNIMPICLLAACYILQLTGKTRLPLLPVCCLSAILCLVLCFRTVPDYIYDEHRDYNLLVDTVADYPCVYLTEYFAPVTQDMLQLMRFEDVYVTGDLGSEALSAYLDGAERAVVYVDTSDFWGSGFSPQEILPSLCEATGFHETEELYRYELSDTFLLKR